MRIAYHEIYSFGSLYAISNVEETDLAHNSSRTCLLLSIVQHDNACFNSWYSDIQFPTLEQPVTKNLSKSLVVIAWICLGMMPRFDLGLKYWGSELWVSFRVWGLGFRGWQFCWVEVFWFIVCWGGSCTVSACGKRRWLYAPLQGFFCLVAFWNLL